MLSGKWFSLIVLCAALIGCGDQSEGANAAPTPTSQPEEVAEVAEPTEPAAEEGAEEEPAPEAAAAVIPPFCPTDGSPNAGEQVGDHRFTIRAFAEGELAAGEVGQFKVHVDAAEGWHVNQDFNTQLKVRANEGLRLDGSIIASAQAAEFTDHHAYFDVPVTPQAAGEHRAESCLSFAICSDETCIPVAPSVAVVLPVQ